MQTLLAAKSLIAYNGYNAGLGNRLRVVLSAQSLAELEQRQFYYVWPTGRLFEPELSKIFNYDAGRVLSRVTSRLLAWRFPYRDPNLNWLQNPTTKTLKIWQFRSATELVLPPSATPWPERLRALRPNDRIQNRVRAAFDAYFKDVGFVGVMIRAHSVSHPQTKQASPLDWYLNRLKEIRKSSPETPIFVSCDVAEVQEQVISSFPNCWGLRDKGTYNSTLGVESAICDLYLLASSGYLIGPHFSSFVHLAQHLAGDLVPMETSLHQPDSRLIDFNRLSRVRDPLNPIARVNKI